MENFPVIIKVVSDNRAYVGGTITALILITKNIKYNLQN